jgi:hypothetical protein
MEATLKMSLLAGERPEPTGGFWRFSTNWAGFWSSSITFHGENTGVRAPPNRRAFSRIAFMTRRALAFFRVGVLRRAEVLARVVEVGQRDRRLEQAALRVGVEQERPELVAKPQRAVVGLPSSTRCRSRRRSASVAGREVVGDRERDVVVRVAEFDVREDLDVPAPPVAVSKFGRIR